jgi:acetylornithine aminotransferase/acetylornithine/N-succinyldiaminopimelate aminotransferase
VNNKEIIELSSSAVMNTYGRFPIALVRGKGTRVWDADGSQYIDFLAGIAVNCLGHCHPAVTEAIQKQAETLVHVSNLYHIAPQAELAKLLTELTFADRVFFGNSGAEANEGAIKLARKYHSDRGDAKRTKIVSATMSFHGRTLATLTATGQDKVKVGFDPLPEGFVWVDYDNIAALEATVDDTTAAVILEPIQGEGGVRVPTGSYLKKVRELCTDRGALLIFDEVQTGAGRTGDFLACEHEGVTPDVATMAKGLGGGVPIGAILATEDAASALGPGTHASTFGGNPLCTAAALATVRTLVEEKLVERTKTIGGYFANKLKALVAKYDTVKEVRGRGLLIGLVLAEEVDPLGVVIKLMERGFLTGTAGVGVLRFAPPLTVEEAEIDALVAALQEILED